MTATDSSHSCDFPEKMPRTSPHCTKCCKLSTRSIGAEERSPVDRATRVRLPSGMMESTMSSNPGLKIENPIWEVAAKRINLPRTIVSASSTFSC